jgi:hypothetical protein
MALHLRQFWNACGIPCVLYLGLLAFGTWVGSLAPAETSELAFQVSVPYIVILAMMGLHVAFGRNCPASTSWDQASQAPAPVSPTCTMWWVASLAVICVTWLAFILLLIWHGYPEHWWAQAWRALAGLWACAAVGLFWGRMAARWTGKWSWLAPVCMAAGWALGQGICNFFRLDPDLSSELRDVPRYGLEKLVSIAFLPLMLIGFIALGGLLWERFGRVNRVSCLVLVPLMVVPNVWDSYLNKWRRETISRQFSEAIPPHAIPAELTGAVQLVPSPVPLHLSPTRKYTPPNRKTWEFAIPWLDVGDDPRIRLIEGFAIRTRLSTGGVSMDSKGWNFAFLRNTVNPTAGNAPMVLWVAYDMKNMPSPNSKGPAPVKKYSAAPPSPPPPDSLKVRANLRVRGYEVLSSFAADESHRFTYLHIKNGSINSNWRRELSYHAGEKHQDIWMDWRARSWHPIPAISGEKDLIFGTRPRQSELFALTLTYRGLTTRPSHCGYAETEMIGFTRESFFEIANHDPDCGWEFEIPEDPATRDHFLSETTVTHFHKIAEWEVPIELDLALSAPP